MVPANSARIPRAPAYSGVYPVSHRFRVRECHPLRRTFPRASAINLISLGRSYYPATRINTPTVWAIPRSLATTWRIVITFSSCGYLDVSVPHVRLRFADVGIAPDRLPHSEIHESMGICPSSWLIAACHVLLRLREPRHPPCALLLLRYVVKEA